MDEPIIHRDIAAGSEKAFRELYEQYRNKIFYSAYKMLKSIDAAEDVLQFFRIIFSYAEAKIKANQIGASFYAAINQIRQQIMIIFLS